MTKTCGKCNKEKDVTSFVNHKTSRDRLSYDCRDCRSVAKKRWDANNKEHKKEYKKRWDSGNKEHIKQYESNNIEMVRTKNKKYMQKHRDENPEIYNSGEHKLKMRSHALKHKYGITAEDYNIMMFEQDGRCGVCNRHQTECKSIFVVDHCHKTGALRKLLCRHCNALLGMCNDNIQVLQNAIKYLT